MKKIVIASDSFKGSLTSLEVAAAVSSGIHAVDPGCEVVPVDIADGGEGTVDALVRTLGGHEIPIQVQDPLGRPVQTRYGWVGEDTAVIEMASASGLPLLREDERNPMVTSTFGTGQMIADALHRGARHFWVGIGGSATNDGGTGMLSALGFQFRNTRGEVLEGCGASLGEIREIDSGGVMPELHGADFTVACDVNTPFCGPMGAAAVFAPQKGADAQMVRELDEGMTRFARLVEDRLHQSIADLPGAGAAGGLGGGFRAFLHARLVPGIQMVLDAIGFERTISGADLIFTGEGRLDSQTALGKTPSGVLAYARKQGIPVIALGGSLEQGLESDGFAGVFPILPGPATLEEAMQAENARRNLTRTTAQIMKTILTFYNL